MSSLIHDYSLYIMLMYMTYIQICFLPTDISHNPQSEILFPTFQYCLNTELQSLFDPMFTRERELVKVLGVYSNAAAIPDYLRLLFLRCAFQLILHLCLLSNIFNYSLLGMTMTTGGLAQSFTVHYVLQSLINQFYLW